MKPEYPRTYWSDDQIIDWVKQHRKASEETYYVILSSADWYNQELAVVNIMTGKITKTKFEARPTRCE